MWRGAHRLRRLIIGVAVTLASCCPLYGADPPLPPPRGFVSDFANVIDAPTEVRLDGVIRELQAKTGAEIAVITVDSTQPLSAFDYAMKVAEQWKPGAKGKDNGVVFLVAVRDRELFILTGYGVEGPLPDGRVGEIRDQLVVPRFRAGDYSGGIRAGTEAMAGIIATEFNVTLTGVPPVRLRPRPSPIAGLIPLIVILIIFFFLIRSGMLPILLTPQYGRRRRYDHWGGSFGGGGFGGSSGGFGGGGFGGFGGGGFGGGGAGGKW